MSNVCTLIFMTVNNTCQICSFVTVKSSIAGVGNLFSLLSTSLYCSVAVTSSIPLDDGTTLVLLTFGCLFFLITKSIHCLSMDLA